MSEQKQAPPKLIEVTLIGNHTHGGKQHVTGDKIKVSEPERVWLIGAKKVAADPAAAKEQK